MTTMKIPHTSVIPPDAPDSDLDRSGLYCVAQRRKWEIDQLNKALRVRTGAIVVLALLIVFIGAPSWKTRRWEPDLEKPEFILWQSTQFGFSQKQRSYRWMVDEHGTTGWREDRGDGTTRAPDEELWMHSSE